MAIDIYQVVTDKIIAQLEAGTRPWDKPWTGGMSLPRRANGVPYRGVNVFLLWMTGTEKGYGNGTWMTYKQAQELGGNVRKGETGTPVCKAGKFEKKEKDAAGVETSRVVPFMKAYTVFNAEQVDGLPEGFGTPPAPASAALDDSQRIAAAEAFYAALGMDLAHGGGSAFYRPSQDRVQMPDFSAFSSPVRYYSTLGHEAVHWTGHASRLNRLPSLMGKPEYAKEELVAELGAAFLSAVLGLDADPREDHAAYVASWLKALHNDKRFIFSASTAAQKAVDFLQEKAGTAAAPDTQEILQQAA